MNNKYELTSDVMVNWEGKKLFRIKALTNFGNVSMGELGGFIEKEDNLSISGDAWVSGNAQVYGYAQVYGNALVYGDAWVSGNAQVYGDAWVYGNTRVYGNAQVYGYAQVSFGQLITDIFKNLKLYIACSLNVFPTDGKYILFKRVIKDSDGHYHSCYDSSFKYVDGEIASVQNPDMDVNKDCSSGIHVSTPFYCSEGDTLIAIEVREEDIITCQSGKLRCKAVKVIGEVKY